MLNGCLDNLPAGPRRGYDSDDDYEDSGGEPPDNDDDDDDDDDDPAWKPSMVNKIGIRGTV